MRSKWRTMLAVVLLAFAGFSLTVVAVQASLATLSTSAAAAMPAQTPAVSRLFEPPVTLPPIPVPAANLPALSDVAVPQARPLPTRPAPPSPTHPVKPSRPTKSTDDFIGVRDGHIVVAGTTGAVRRTVYSEPDPANFVLRGVAHDGDTVYFERAGRAGGSAPCAETIWQVGVSGAFAARPIAFGARVAITPHTARLVYVQSSDGCHAHDRLVLEPLAREATTVLAPSRSAVTVESAALASDGARALVVVSEQSRPHGVIIDLATARHFDDGVTIQPSGDETIARAVSATPHNFVTARTLRAGSMPAARLELVDPDSHDLQCLGLLPLGMTVGSLAVRPDGGNMLVLAKHNNGAPLLLRWDRGNFKAIGPYSAVAY